MKRQFELEGKTVTAACNALLPKLYRNQFGTDIMMDLQKFNDAAQKDPQTANFTVLENVTWLMLKEGGEDVGETPDEWMRGLESPVSVYMLSGEVLGLWRDSQKSVVIPKKK